MAGKSTWPSVMFRWFFIISEIWLFRVISDDNFAFMSGSLKTFQVHASDGRELNISCFENTVINIHYAHYVPHRTNKPCQVKSTADDENINRTSSTSSGNSLKVIEQICREQRICRLLTSPKTFQEDPCPGVKKYAEVAYKCRPTEFVNKIVCENEKMELSCNESLGILVYSAYFGTQVHGVAECPLSVTNEEECQFSFGTDKIKKCNGHKLCSIVANSGTFGNSGCSSLIHPYLKVVFTCVPKGILKTQFLEGSEYHVESSSDVLKDRTTSYPAWAQNIDDDVLRFLVSQSLNMSSNSVTLKQSDDLLLPSSSDDHENKSASRNIVMLIAEGIAAYKFVAGNKTKLILYVSVSVGVGSLFFVVVVIFHICLCKPKSQDDYDVPAISEDDFFSDSDLEHFEGNTTTPAPPTVGSADRKISESVPLTPIEGTNNNHYFS